MQLPTVPPVSSLEGGVRGVISTRHGGAGKALLRARVVWGSYESSSERLLLLRDLVRASLLVMSSSDT